MSGKNDSLADTDRTDPPSLYLVETPTRSAPPESTRNIVRDLLEVCILIEVSLISSASADRSKDTMTDSSLATAPEKADTPGAKNGGDHPNESPQEQTHDCNYHVLIYKKSRSELTAVFFYGTLLVPAILIRVLGHDCSHLTFQDALLPVCCLVEYCKADERTIRDTASRERTIPR